MRLQGWNSRGQSGAFEGQAGSDHPNQAEDRALGRSRRLRALALAETSEAFTRHGPSSEAVFQALARRMARRIAGACLIRPRPGGSERVPLAASHARLASRQSLADLLLTSPDSLASAYCAWVAERGRSILTPEVSSKSLRRWTEPAAWPYLDGCRISTFLVVPVLSADRVVGTLALWRELPGQPLDDDDQLFAEEVGRRLVAR